MNKPFKVPDHVLKEQYASSDPAVSAWVAANAGSGKTHVLTQRVIRLMLDGNTPDRILCLTFTKAAAANMKTRVFDTLAVWTMMEDAELDDAVHELSGQQVTAEIRNRARRLFTQALDTPGGLKIQTIHAFCESLLHQFPLEANVPGHFETLQEVGQAALLEEARAYVLSGNSHAGDVSDSLRLLSSQASMDAIERGIRSLVANRNDFLEWISGGISSALEPVYETLDVLPSDTANSVKRTFLDNIPVSETILEAVMDAAGQGPNLRDKTVLANLKEFLASSIAADRFHALEELCLTKGHSPSVRKSIVTAFVQERITDANETMKSLAEAILAARDKINSIKLLDNSKHLFEIAENVLERYSSLKRSKGLIDFDDQVDRCASLLNRSEIREWIRYRLDRGIDHVLVDEAQDTSPKQWEIINAITADFNTGNTAAARNRTVFVVGDEKQSIYSFQGAKPAEFAHQQRDLKRVVTAAGKPFHPGRLALSFRSTSDVLHAVDLVFDDESNRRGLMQSGEKPTHDAVRQNDPGEVYVWPLFTREKTPDQESWMDPVDHVGQSDPAVELAERIAETIAEWTGKTLPGSDGPLKYGDILVLVRKRDRFITALTRTMKDRGLRVAGADRLTLTDHIAVEDLLALSQFVLLPQDDLNLACVLKGVLFNLDEETLFEFAHDRNEATLFESITSISNNETHPLQDIARNIIVNLEELITRSQELGVFEFFAWVLGPFGMRKAFLSRLGLEAEDVLDAFLDETIAFSNEGGIGLESFISTLLLSNPEIKREVELERDEVRILTVHASKGLEAKVVFLVDPCNAPWTEKHRPPVLPIGEGYIWLPNSEMHVDATRKSSDMIRVAAEEEYRRLLYVGMTRAADRLVVCGFRGVTEPKHQYWHQMVSDALEGTAEKLKDDDGNITALRWRENEPGNKAVTERTGVSDNEVPKRADYPEWLVTRVDHEKPLPQPLTATGAFALIEEDSQEAVSSEPFRRGQDQSFAIQRGRVIHRLLEFLPDVPVEERTAQGMQYLEAIGTDWTQAQRNAVWADVDATLSDERFARILDCVSSVEVALAGMLKTHSGERMIAGQIDRLVIRKGVVSIIDYKTNFRIPEAIPPQILSQLALYQELTRQIYPNHEIECHIVWVSKPELVRVPDQLLEEALENIKKI